MIYQILEIAYTFALFNALAIATLYAQAKLQKRPMDWCTRFYVIMNLALAMTYFGVKLAQSSGTRLEFY